MSTAAPFLFGNTFPLSLIRRRTTIEPRSIEELKETFRKRAFASFWGHRNTLSTASAMLGVDVSPKSERPTIGLDLLNFPVFDGVRYDDCWLLSPEYAAGFRPEIGAETPQEMIRGWVALHIEWL